MDGPPPKKKARPACHQNALTLQSSSANNGANGAFPQFRKEHALIWKHEVERLFREFWSTGSLRHLSSFVVHVVAMRRRLAGGLGR
jgi:hypothetical protein